MHELPTKNKFSSCTPNPTRRQNYNTNVQKAINTNTSTNNSIRPNNDPKTPINTYNQSINNIKLHAMAYPATQDETSLHMSPDMCHVPKKSHAKSPIKPCTLTLSESMQIGAIIPLSPTPSMLKHYPHPSQNAKNPC